MKLEEIKKLLRDKEPINYKELKFGYNAVDKFTGESKFVKSEYSAEVLKDFETIKSKYNKKDYEEVLNKLQYNHELNKDFKYDILQFYVDDELFKRSVLRGDRVIREIDFVRTIQTLFNIRYLKESEYQLLKNNLKKIKEILNKSPKHEQDLKYVKSFEIILDEIKKNKFDIESKYLNFDDILTNLNLFLI